ncbi:TIGR02117 family protein [Pontibacter oryzae]|uniref:TIGR02117 family protein n=1 Tax=Pontibacter oryzae TaxID=2304593 RepID=A0A399RQE5_9BACT|nr:TIGR02117 family protein [Pontibacter oryzae]RIJ34030.1 TIGR02117 family protein [Pontibacter oryzae]
MQGVFLKMIRVVSWALLIVAGLMLAFVVTAFVLSSIPVNSGFAQPPAQQNQLEIFVTSNGVHTDIVVPVATSYIDWRTKLPLHQFEGIDSSYQYIAFGWGDRRFYMETPSWTDLTPSVALTAALWPTRAAMHVEYIKHKLIPTKRQQPVYISPKQYLQLIHYIEASFVQQQGQFKHIPGSGYTPQDTFYEAHGRFYILNNCNNWVNNGLKQMGFKTGLWAPLPFAVMRHLR